MTDSVQRFISELIRAANEVDKLTKAERANLLRRAAFTIRDQRDEINYSETPANDTGSADDIVFELKEMARLVDIFAPAEIARHLIEAVEVIKAGRVLLDAKPEIEGEN